MPHFLTVAGTSSSQTRPSRCDLGAMSSGLLSASTSSRWTRSVTRRSRTSVGGETWIRPDFTVHARNPGASIRASTQITRSWCQSSAQFASADLSKYIARTGLADRPTTEAATPPIRPSGASRSARSDKSERRTPARCTGRLANEFRNRSRQSDAAPANSCAPSVSKPEVRPAPPRRPWLRRRRCTGSRCRAWRPSASAR